MLYIYETRMQLAVVAVAVALFVRQRRDELRRYIGDDAFLGKIYQEEEA